MLHRRRFLALGLAGGTFAGFAGASRAASPATTVAASLPGESIFAYIQRVRGQWDAGLYKQLLGAANAFKEGDEIIGVAASDDNARSRRVSYCLRHDLARLTNTLPFATTFLN